jgi:hypothetical protein
LAGTETTASIQTNFRSPSFSKDGETQEGLLLLLERILFQKLRQIKSADIR